ncbi:MAG: hypothetical protein ABFS86_17335 [Planctomycetota bacterium]
MKRTALTVCLLLAVAAVTAGGEPPPEPVSKLELHFRIEVGVEPGHVVAGYLDESKGTGKGFDRIALDLDGDGEYETVQEAATQKDYRTQKTIPKPQVTIEREGATWILDLYSIGRVRPVVRDGKVQTYAHWSVTSGELYAWFINGRVTLHADAAKAKAGKPIRLGPPFRFETGSGKQGPDATVRVGLKDSQGFTMRLARKDKAQQQIRVRLAGVGQPLIDTHAPYG